MEEIQAVIAARQETYLRISHYFSRLLTKRDAPKDRLVLMEHVVKTTNLPRPLSAWGADDIPQN
jgi:hypothetical protein